VKKAARDDLKNPDLKLHEDASLDHTGRLRHAAELLEQTRSDLASEEDNPDAREHRRRALEHVDRAIDSTRHAVQDIVSAAKTVH
jgi:hypothetical protein